MSAIGFTHMDLCRRLVAQSMTVNKLTRPILQYYGGKWRIAPKIIAHFPDHVCYVKPYGGGASILLRKKPSKVEVYNDMYGEVVNFFKCLRDKTDDLVWLLSLTPTALDEWAQAKNECIDGMEDLEKARNFWIHSWQDRNAGGSKGWTGWKRSRHVMRLPLGVDNMYAAAQRLRDVYIDNVPAEYCISYYDTPDVLFYIDPPYIKKGSGYALSMSVTEHEILLDQLLDVEGYVVISCVDNDVYHDILGYNGWIIKKFSAATQRGSHNIEAIWMNYE